MVGHFDVLFHAYSTLAPYTQHVRIMGHWPRLHQELWRTGLFGDLACLCNHWFAGLLVLGEAQE